jgi:AraC-like DNA-binding protein
MSFEVARHESPELSFEMMSRGAHPRLRGLVRDYIGYDEHSREPLCRREVPSGDVHLILSPESELTVGKAGTVSRHTSFVAALHESHSLVEHGGRQHGIEVRLTPLGAYALFGFPMDELSNRVVELDDLLGAKAHELVGRLFEPEGWHERFGLLDALLAARADDGRGAGPGVAWAWRRLGETSGRTSVRGLAEELGWSQRRLVARFREQVGLPPKAFARILRFERVSALLQGVEGARLAEVAYDCGYFDQAHLNRDFREFAGTTPTEYIAARLPPGGGVAG